MELQVKPTNLIANIEQAKNYLIEVIKKSKEQMAKEKYLRSASMIVFAFGLTV